MRMKNTRTASTRKPVNVTIQANVLADAKALGINVSRVADAAVARAVREEKERRWLKENREAIEAHNAWIEKNGMLIQPLWMRDDVTF